MGAQGPGAYNLRSELPPLPRRVSIPSPIHRQPLTAETRQRTKEANTVPSSAQTMSLSKLRDVLSRSHSAGGYSNTMPPAMTNSKKKATRTANASEFNVRNAFTAVALGNTAIHLIMMTMRAGFQVTLTDSKEVQPQESTVSSLADAFMDFDEEQLYALLADMNAAGLVEEEEEEDPMGGYWDPTSVAGIEHVLPPATTLQDLDKVAGQLFQTEPRDLPEGFSLLSSTTPPANASTTAAAAAIEDPQSTPSHTSSSGASRRKRHRATSSLTKTSSRNNMKPGASPSGSPLKRTASRPINVIGVTTGKGIVVGDRVIPFPELPIELPTQPGTTNRATSAFLSCFVTSVIFMFCRCKRGPRFASH